MERQRIYQWLFTLAIATFGTLLSAYVYLGLKKSDDSRVLAEFKRKLINKAFAPACCLPERPRS